MFPSSINRVLLALAALPVSFPSKTAATNEHFSIISDLHYDPTYWTVREGCKDAAFDEPGPPPTYGTFDCEPSWQLIENAVHNMAIKGSGAKFIIWLGDNGHHWSHTLTSPTILTSDVMFEIIQNVTDLLKEKVDDTRILPVLGNHDWIPKNELPAAPNAGYDRLVDMWSSWLDASSDLDTFRRGGYYSILVDDTMKTRAVVLNTNLYLTSNYAVSDVDEDPAGQFAWLEATLRNARDFEERVLLISHVPIGMGEIREYGYRCFMNTTANARLIGLVRDYNDVIIGIVSGHSHIDAFRLIYDENTAVPVAYQLTVPAISPRRNPNRGSNPGFRIVHYDYMTGQPVDYDQYYLDITKIAEDGTADPTWEQEYSFKQDYGLRDLNARTLHGLLLRFKQYASEEFADYYAYTTVSVPDDEFEPCDCSCKKAHLCSVEFVEPEKHGQCMSMTTCGSSATTISLTLAFMVALSYIMLG